MTDFEKAINVLETEFNKDMPYGLATSENNVPSLRVVDAVYHDGYFWVVTYNTSRKVVEIEKNSNVAMCRFLNSFSGVAENVGHPLLPQNAKIRDFLTEVFKAWYFEHNDEADKEMCYVRIKLTTGFYYANGTGYKVDFNAKTAKSFPFSPDIIEA